ncbi:hypothetical protein SPND219_01856 [Streptococcus pneumoniae]|nr:hypothetical protein SPND219_01856 [Streptococcus pneumoniae]
MEKITSPFSHRELVVAGNKQRKL